jgi:hypothetical protein
MPQLARRYYPLQYGLFGLCLVTFGVLFFEAAERGTLFYGALAVFVLSAVATLLVDRWLLQRVNCPQCSAPLSREKAPRGRLISIQYHCPHCDVLWDADAESASSRRSSPSLLDRDPEP